MTFDSEDRDVFGSPDRKHAKRREFRFPFGKYKGQPLSNPDVPTSYLEWMLREGRLTPMWKSAFEKEVRIRQVKERFGAFPVNAN